MKRPQWITLVIAMILVAIIYKFGRIVPQKGAGDITQSAVSDDSIATETILAQAKKRLSPPQVTRLSALEHSVIRGDTKRQSLEVYHQLAHFWSDSVGLFELYAWYEAQGARLENSEKSLTFAAHLFLENLRGENDPALRAWKSLQAKDLFERSLKINPYNDSSTIGLAACYIFGAINANPMEGIMKVRTVAEKDSTNIFAQEVLGHGSMISGQYDRAIARFETVYRLSAPHSDSRLESCLMLAEACEQKSDKLCAINWYEKSMALLKNEEIKEEVKKRIGELRK